MSASVFQPSSFSQMSRLIRASSTAAAGRRRPVVVDPQARSRVARSLFGPIDHEATRRFVASELAEINLRDQRRWSFNFQMEKPTEGANDRYSWQRITTAVPEAYRLPNLESEQPTTLIKTTSTTETARPTTRTTVRRKASNTSTPNNNLRQLKITDFTRVKRKRSYDDLLGDKTKIMKSDIIMDAISSTTTLEPPIKQSRAT